MAKQKFERTKPHLNVGTIGHIDHGKTTLTAAVSARQAHRFGGARMDYDDIGRGGIVRDPSKIVTVVAAHVPYETAHRHYAHTDCPGRAADDACRCIDELMDALDASIPTPVRFEDRPFLMAVEKVHSVVGRGTVAVGRVERGRVRAGDAVEIVGLRPQTRKTVAVSV